ncbi:MAG: prolyl oligopeptidase family serine peptidase [Planctomycetaceae bacterium]|nr:prolyl oligopeptidase family serine peptidase [Planctomycetaceae bacterium]
MSYPNQWPPQPYQAFQQPQRRSSNWGLTAAILGGGALVLAVLCCGGLAMAFRTPAASAAAKQPFAYTDVPPPAFPDRSEAEQHELEPGVVQHVISIGDEEGGFYDTPGHGGYMYLYLPPGEHAAKSLPCILIAPAGSTLLAGMDLAEEDEPEHTPFVKAGCAVLSYELDGPCYDDSDLDLMREAYDEFKEARAGLVNARNALDYVLAKVPEVDPARIYAAGHSSAATHALLVAAHEPRLAGVMAYAPATDLPKRMGWTLALYRYTLPGLVDFVTQSSPSTHAAALKRPVFLFHAEDDSNCPIADTRAFADKLKQQGADVKFVTAASGDHYDSMINEGIPAAIQWLRERKAIK